MTPYLSKRVFPDDGAYMSIHQDIYLYIALFLGLVTLRMETSFFRFVSDAKYKDKIFPLASRLIIYLSIGFIIICSLFLDQINQLLKYPNLQTQVFLGAVIVFFDAICSLPFAFIRYNGQAKRYAYIKVISVIFNILCVLFLFEVFPKLWPNGGSLNIGPANRLWLILLANVAASVLAFLFLAKEFKLVFIQKVDWTLLKPVMEYSWPLILVTLAFTINTTGATSFLKLLLPGSNMQNFEASKDYVAAWRLAVIMNIFVTTFNYAAEPFFFRHKELSDSKNLYAKVSLYFVIACCLIYISICLFKDIALFFFPKAYLGSIYLISILMMANIFSGISTNFSAWYKLSDNTKMAAYINLIALLITFLLSFMLIPRFGIDASAWILLSCNVFITIASYLQGQKTYPIPYNIPKMVIYLLVSVIIVVFVPKITEVLSTSIFTQYFVNSLVILCFCSYVYFFELKRKFFYS